MYQLEHDLQELRVAVEAADAAARKVRWAVGECQAFHACHPPASSL